MHHPRIIPGWEPSAGASSLEAEPFGPAPERRDCDWMGARGGAQSQLGSPALVLRLAKEGRDPREKSWRQGNCRADLRALVSEMERGPGRAAM